MARFLRACFGPRSRRCYSPLTCGQTARDTNMTSFEEIDEPRRLLGLGETATIKEIKQAYRRMVQGYHPDIAEQSAEAEEMTKALNRAYKLLTEYCACYKYSFKEEDVDRAYPEERLMKRCGRGWFDGI